MNNGHRRRAETKGIENIISKIIENFSNLAEEIAILCRGI
jgi:hypothetical protein